MDGSAVRRRLELALRDALRARDTVAAGRLRREADVLTSALGTNEDP